jgi:hypothetical protein
MDGNTLGNPIHAAGRQIHVVSYLDRQRTPHTAGGMPNSRRRAPRLTQLLALL